MEELKKWLKSEITYWKGRLGSVDAGYIPYRRYCSAKVGAFETTLKKIDSSGLKNDQ